MGASRAVMPPNTIFAVFSAAFRARVKSYAMFCCRHAAVLLLRAAALAAAPRRLYTIDDMPSASAMAPRHLLRLSAPSLSMPPFRVL